MYRITTEMIDICRQQNILDIAMRLGIRVDRGKALCPFHDDHSPSLRFKYNRYKCFACGQSGDAIRLAQHVLSASFVDAVGWICNGSAAYLPPATFTYSSSAQQPYSQPDLSDYEYIFRRPVLTPTARTFLFEKRKISPQVVERQRISSNHTHIIIPYYNVDGTALLTIQWRYMGTDKHTPRFLFAKGCRPQMYNLPILAALQPTDPLYIAEGVTDCLAMMSRGHNAIAIPSATLLRPSDATTLLKRHKNIYMCPDNDMPGTNLYNQLKTMLPNITKIHLPAKYKDFGEMWAEIGC